MNIIGLMACTEKGVIGSKGRIPWRYPNELKHFQEITHNQIIIMGRKTFEEMSKLSLLKNRKSIVFTRNYSLQNEPTNAKVFRNLDDAYKTGFEIMAGVDFCTNFNFTTELAYVYAKNNDLNESLPLVPPLVTRFKLGYEKEKFWVNAEYVIRMGNK